MNADAATHRSQHPSPDRGLIMTDTKVETITIPEPVRAGDNILYPGTYRVVMPTDYDPAEVGGGDILSDDAMWIVEDHGVYRVIDSHEVLSTERATCERCGIESWLGDLPEQGGIVADPRESGALLCDDCAETATEEREARIHAESIEDGPDYDSFGQWYTP